MTIDHQLNRFNGYVYTKSIT